jgi:2-amino-4-hydroxy-6-hydroxymethyldihydropteridine diphosphokinase
VRYWIGLGANLGDRLANLRAAVAALERLGTVEKRSRVFAAAPVGGPPQPPFLNAAVLLECALNPVEVLAECRRIEDELGRTRDVRWGPRTLDADLLLIGPRGEYTVESDELLVPHERLHERGFALAPLCDLDAELVHPTLGRTIAALLHAAVHQGHAVAPTGDRL